MGQDDPGAQYMRLQLKSACSLGAQHLQKPVPSASFSLIRTPGSLPNTKMLD